MSEVTYRWIDGPTASDADWEKIESVLASRGWMSLNRNGTRILVAERDGTMAFHVFQFVPFCGPLFVPPSMRGTDIAMELANRMVEFLAEINARGWLVVADSPHAAKLCEENHMTKVESSVYVMVNPGGVEV
jgi:hypothetical protein